MIVPRVLLLLVSSWLVNSTVLDPALYLAPSPPLMISKNSLSPAEMWSQSLEARNARVDREIATTTEYPLPDDSTKIIPTSQRPEAASRMFWPRYGAEPTGVHIPLTFSISGSYGRVAPVSRGVIGSTYTSVSDIVGKSASLGGFGRSGLAGSSYGNYGTGIRIYGGDSPASWSGWGNGKWGHYGKG